MTGFVTIDKINLVTFVEAIDTVVAFNGAQKNILIQFAKLDDFESIKGLLDYVGIESSFRTFYYSAKVPVSGVIRKVFSDRQANCKSIW